MKAIRLNSLKFRLMVSAFFMIVVLLPIIGFTLNNAFERQLKTAINNELSAYSYSILAVAEVENSQLNMPEYLLENQFNVSESGLYAIFTQPSEIEYSGQVEQKTLWSSASILALLLPDNLPMPALGESLFSELNIENTQHFMYSFTVSFTVDNNAEKTQRFPLTTTLHIIKEQTDFLKVNKSFKQQLWSWLLALMFIFVMVELVWLLWTLKPLRTLQKELEQVEQGNSLVLNAAYPDELKQVTNQLNSLLRTEQNQRKRYRNALSDLAHSLKTPLAVIQSQSHNQSEMPQNTFEQLRVINNIIEHQLKRAQSAGELSWHIGVSVNEVIDKLVNSLNKIYLEKKLNITINISEPLTFKGDEADLMEILGNLLDNAYKAARSKVLLKACVDQQHLVFIISDDGPGITHQQQKLILQRGARADTYQQGHGIGLAIVNDLVASYQGTLTIESLGGDLGAVFTVKFRQ